MYKVGDHPRIRVTEANLDKQLLKVFRAIRQTNEICDWFSEALRERLRPVRHRGIIRLKPGPLRSGFVFGAPQEQVGWICI
jgi:hypothetical protein